MDSPARKLIILQKGSYSLAEIRDELDAFLNGHARDLDKNRIFLALEEAIVNVFEHTYANRSGELRMTLMRMNRTIRIKLEDDGPAFDPTTIPLPDPEDLAESGRDGGYGLFLMRSIMQVEHRARTEGGNLLILEKVLPETASDAPGKSKD